MLHKRGAAEPWPPATSASTRWRTVTRLKDKVAIITGGAHGMAEAEARLFAAEGAKVVVAEILAEDADVVAAAIRAGGGEATAAKIDVASEAEWAGPIGKTLAAYGRLPMPPSATTRSRLRRCPTGQSPWAEGRRIGKPIEVAYGVLFLASDEASLMTGAELVIDGGFITQ